jgi:hypothetical protein
MAIQQVVHSNYSQDSYYYVWYDIWWILKRIARERQYIKWCI